MPAYVYSESVIKFNNNVKYKKCNGNHMNCANAI